MMIGNSNDTPNPIQKSENLSNQLNNIHYISLYYHLSLIQVHYKN